MDIKPITDEGKIRYMSKLLDVSDTKDLPECVVIMVGDDGTYMELAKCDEPLKMIGLLELMKLKLLEP